MFKAFFLLALTLLPLAAEGQLIEYSQKKTNRNGAVVRNLILPGWGHAYASGGAWRSGRGFLFADVVLLSSYFGLTAQSAHLQGNLSPYAAQHAGTSIDGKDRSFLLAVTNYNSLEEYNSEMLRLRQWNALLEDSPENQWSWNSEAERLQFVRLKDRYDRAEQNRPAILTMLVMNRAISAIAVYRKAGKSNGVAMRISGNSVQQPVFSVSIPF